MTNTHPYVRAYMAGIALPTVFMLIVFSVFCVVRFGYRADVPIERVIIFPLALVPNLWGLWNIAYLALHAHRRLPLGLHGALLPLILVPLAVVAAGALQAGLPGFFPTVVWIALPAIVILYYLLWKYVVGFFNALLGIAE